MIKLSLMHCQCFSLSFCMVATLFIFSQGSRAVHRQQRACRHRVHAIFLWPSRSMFNEGDELSENRIWWVCDKNQYHMWRPKTFWAFRRGCFGARLNFSLHYLQAMCSVASASNIANDRKKTEKQTLQSSTSTKLTFFGPDLSVVFLIHRSGVLFPLV